MRACARSGRSLPWDRVFCKLFSPGLERLVVVEPALEVVEAGRPVNEGGSR